MSLLHRLFFIVFLLSCQNANRKVEAPLEAHESEEGTSPWVLALNAEGFPEQSNEKVPTQAELAAEEELGKDGGAQSLKLADGNTFSMNLSRGTGLRS